MSRSPGGLVFIDAATRDELSRPVARPPMAHPRPAPSFSPGHRFAARLASEYFVTDPEAWLVELHDAALLVTRAPIATVESLVPLLEACAHDARAIAIAAPAISDDVVGFLVANKLRGILHCAAFELATTELSAIAWPANVALADVPRVRQLVASPTELSIRT